MSEQENDIVFYGHGTVARLGSFDQLAKKPLSGSYDIDSLGLRRQTRNALVVSGLTTHAHIELFISQGLLGRVRNVGKGREQEIREKLQRRSP